MLDVRSIGFTIFLCTNACIGTEPLTWPAYVAEEPSTQIVIVEDEVGRPILALRTPELAPLQFPNTASVAVAELPCSDPAFIDLTRRATPIPSPLETWALDSHGAWVSSTSENSIAGEILVEAPDCIPLDGDLAEIQPPSSRTPPLLIAVNPNRALWVRTLAEDLTVEIMKQPREASESATSMELPHRGDIVPITSGGIQSTTMRFGVLPTNDSTEVLVFEAIEGTILDANNLGAVRVLGAVSTPFGISETIGVLGTDGSRFIQITDTDIFAGTMTSTTSTRVRSFARICDVPATDRLQPAANGDLVAIPGGQTLYELDGTSGDIVYEELLPPTLRVPQQTQPCVWSVSTSRLGIFISNGTNVFVRAGRGDWRQVRAKPDRSQQEDELQRLIGRHGQLIPVGETMGLLTSTSTGSQRLLRGVACPGGLDLISGRGVASWLADGPTTYVVVNEDPSFASSEYSLVAVTEPDDVDYRRCWNGDLITDRRD